VDTLLCVKTSPPDNRRSRFEDLAGEVYEPIQRYLRRRANIDQVDDLVVDVMTVLWKRLDDVPAGAALPWAYAVARRCLSNTRRANARRLRLIRKLETERPIRDREPPGLDVELEEALESLPTDQEEILRLWAWEQLEASEIATVLGCSANAASIRLHRARRALKSAMERKTTTVDGHTRVEHTEEERS